MRRAAEVRFARYGEQLLVFLAEVPPCAVLSYVVALGCE